MNEKLIPDFNWQQHVVAPWGEDEISITFWIVLLAIFVITTCGLIGNYLILRRMALVGDAISHSVLAGIAVVVVAPVMLNLNHIQVSTTAMLIGALVAGVLTTVIIEVIHRHSRVKQDAAIGIAFTSLFALGVVLITLKVNNSHIDTECILYGDMIYVISEKSSTPLNLELASTLSKLPLSSVFIEGNRLVLVNGVLRMAVITLVVAILIWAFYKELLVSSFDPDLAFSLGINSTVVHYSLMALLSLVVVSAFESVGAILVVAMLILPGATAHLLTARLPVIFLLSVIHAILCSLIGYHISVWLDCSIAGAMVVASTMLFTLAWLFSPHDGLLGKLIRRRQIPSEMPPPIADDG